MGVSVGRAYFWHDSTKITIHLHMCVNFEPPYDHSVVYLCCEAISPHQDSHMWLALIIPSVWSVSQETFQRRFALGTKVCMTNLWLICVYISLISARSSYDTLRRLVYSCVQGLESMERFSHLEMRTRIRTHNLELIAFQNWSFY